MADLPTPPLWLPSGTYAADDDRALLRSLVQGQGIVEPTHLAVTANGTPNMSVNVAPGRAYVLRTGAVDYYVLENDSITNLTISAANATNPRIDIVVARVYDAAFSGTLNKATLEVVTGTPAAVPVAPAVPANSVKLCEVRVDASVTSIVSGKITDFRGQPSYVRGGIQPVANAAARTALTPYFGQHVIEADTGLEYLWTGAAWRAVGPGPLGTLGYAQAVAPQGPFGSAATDLTGLSVTVNVLAGRRIRISALTTFLAQTANGRFSSYIMEGASVLQIAVEDQGVNGFTTFTPSVVLTPTAGSHTYKMQGGCTAGSTMTMDAGTNRPAYILVEDIGV